MASSLLPNLVLGLHVAFVAFVVGGAITIASGALLGWRWVRSARFRGWHLAAVLFVGVRAVAGWPCPLTMAEQTLRGQHNSAEGVAEHLAEALVFRGVDEKEFSRGALLWTALALFLWLAVRPTESGLRAASPTPARPDLGGQSGP